MAHDDKHKEKHEYTGDDPIVPANIGEFGVAELDAGGQTTSPPEDHASTHEGGTDPITPAGIGAEPADATIMKDGDNVSLLTNDADFQSGTQAQALVDILETFLTQVTKKLDVDVNRVDAYTENGSEAKPYKLLQDAINIATSGTLLDIMPGTYPEDITLKPGVYLRSKLGLQPGIMITGKVSWPSGAGTILMNGIYVLNDSDHAIDFGGTGVQKLRAYNSKFETNSIGAHHGINHSNTNVGSEIFLKDSLILVRDSSGGAKAIETVITSQGAIGLDNTSIRLIDDIDNIAVNLKGAIAYWHRMDEIRGRVIVADLASCNISLEGMYADTLSCLETNSAGLSVLSSVILSSTASPIVTGAGAFAFSHIGYSSTGQGLAETLNGGEGAAIGAIPAESADGIIYDPTISELTATRVKTALDELAGSVGGGKSMLLLGEGTGLSGNQTGYLASWGVYSVEASAQVRMLACTLKRLTIYISSNTVTGDTVYTINKNGVATGLTVTFGNVETGRKTIATDITFADGDLLSLEVVIGGNPSQGIFYKEASVEMEG